MWKSTFTPVASMARRPTKDAIPRRSSVLWIQWTTVVIFLGIMLLVDLMFLDDSAFVFDPDPVNWRRRTERSY